MNTTNQNLIDAQRIFIKAMKKNGLDTVFGVVGIPVTDLARLMQEEGVRYIGFRHEQSAGNAAAISGFITKKPGICLTVSAPGFLNGLTALANATTNGFPMIQISGSSDRAIIDLQQGDYEELDQMNIAKPFCKAAYRINRPEDIGIGLARAIRAATSGRPGGVYLDLTTALLGSTMDATAAETSTFTLIEPEPMVSPSQTSVDRALELLSNAKQPLIILGKGAAYAQADEDIKNFIEQAKIPYLPMSMAKGLLPDDHELCCEAARGLVMKNADVVMLIGARLNWLLSHGKGKHWNPNVKFIQLDIDGKEIDSNQPIAAPVVGHICASMKMMLKGLPQHPMHIDADWLNKINTDRQANVAKMAAKYANVTSPMNYFCALKAIREVMLQHKEFYFVNEGANTLDDGRNAVDMYIPRHRLDCGTWGVMGIGMGYAIGAGITTGKPVVCLEGDSAFGFSGMEIETICRYKLPITIVIFNNGGIYRGDRPNLGGGPDPSPTTLMPDARYDKLIEAFGGVSYNVLTPDELQKAMTEAIDSKKPSIINCTIDPSVGLESGHIGNLNPTVKL